MMTLSKKAIRRKRERRSGRSIRPLPLPLLVVFLSVLLFMSPLLQLLTSSPPTSPSTSILTSALKIPLPFHKKPGAAAEEGEDLSIEEAVEILVPQSSRQKTALMGKLFPIISKFFVSKSSLSLRQIICAIFDMIDEAEVALFIAIGWGLVPLSQSIYELYTNVTTARTTTTRLDDDFDWNNLDLESEKVLFDIITEEEEQQQQQQQQKSIPRKAYEAITPWDDDQLRRRQKIQQHVNENYGGDVHAAVQAAALAAGKNQPSSSSSSKKTMSTSSSSTSTSFRNSLVFQIVDHIAQASRVGVAVILVDCIALIGKLMGNPHEVMDNLSRIFSKVAYTGWITHRLQAFKRYLLRKTLGKSTIDEGKLNIVDHLVDGLMYSVWLLFLLDFLEVQTGMALKSLFSVGATGTLVFGLASKDIASQIMNGLTLHLSEKMFEGDEVRFSDGTSGVIVKMGWMETMIRSSDELVVGIPNTHLSGQRVYNLSRTPRSQVKQTLRISYNDADKIPKLLDAIKEEIKEACPKLITDGSRAFRAYWQNYEDDHLAVVVDCHFTIKPTGDEYWRNRQQMLEAIYRAVKKTGVHFEKAVKS